MTKEQLQEIFLKGQKVAIAELGDKDQFLKLEFGVIEHINVTTEKNPPIMGKSDFVPLTTIVTEHAHLNTSFTPRKRSDGGVEFLTGAVLVKKFIYYPID